MDGDHRVEDSEAESYLGDKICANASNDKNIQDRMAKGTSSITQILSILEENFYGKHHFKVAKMLRNSLLVNSMVFNSEAWYNLTQKNIKDLESCDISLHRKIYNTKISCPIPLLYLELGTTPIRFI